MLVLAPIFGEDLRQGQYAYRSGQSALDAVRPMLRLANSGRGKIADGDLSNYFGEIPRAELVHSITRCMSDRRVPGWIGL